LKICFTGDIFLGGDIENGLPAEIKCTPFSDAEKRIINLESPITDLPILEKENCILTTSSKTGKYYLNKWNINAVNLANNHMHDMGTEGILDTINNLKEIKISYFGGGKNLIEASKPYKINASTSVFGFCDFKKKHLNDVLIATKRKPGVNPLTLTSILSCLGTLKNSEKAILMMHWGQEHVYFPPEEDIILAKTLLLDPRVLGIVGMHAHLIQGHLKLNNKRAYFCLGNFLFPNFFVKPRLTIKNIRMPYPKSSPNMRTYNSVFDIVYKKWRLTNRISKILIFDTKKTTFKDWLVLQEDNKPIVRLYQQKIPLIKLFINFISFFYKINTHLYRLVFIYLVNPFSNLFIWTIPCRVSSAKSYIRFNGLKSFIDYIFKNVF
jgi:hypothetical protein